jgi:hypothetical protein
MTERNDETGALQRPAVRTEGFVCFESFPAKTSYIGKSAGVDLV